MSQVIPAVLVDRLAACLADDEQVTFVLGSGVGGQATPSVSDILRLADQYALGRGDGGDLSRALDLARTQAPRDSPIEVYAAYRKVFADWISGDEFDVIGQQAVLEVYRPPERMSSALATHGLWQRVERDLGEAVENDLGSWLLSVGLEALGTTLAQVSGAFGDRIITTNFDPLMEIAIRSANGRAASVPLGADGSYDREAGRDGAIQVFHPHGFWRPTLAATGGRLLHDPGALTDASLVGGVAELITGDTVCVIGTSDWPGTVSQALALVARQRPIRVLWARHGTDQVGTTTVRDRLRRDGIDFVELFEGVDSERLLVEFAQRLRITVTPRAAGPRHRTRHSIWERELVSQPDTAPPQDRRYLLRQLERRFGWHVASATSGIPEVLFWPVRLRPKASVIHMVQAFAAGALTARGMRLVVALDDFGIWRADTVRQPFEADLTRWLRHTAGDLTPRFVSLSAFIAQQRQVPASEDLLRTIDPWTVARDFYGEHNPSVYSVLVALKVVPNLALHDLERDAPMIVQALLRHNANRLLTPLTMWPFLHHLLHQHPGAAVMTLGGREEGLFWEQWRKVYGFGLSQLYNPYIRSLSHKSGMLRWHSRDELAANLRQLYELGGWQQDGGYLPWLFQNAVLLPGYLRHDDVPEIDGLLLDSWSAFQVAVDNGLPAVELLADRASELYLGRTWS